MLHFVTSCPNNLFSLSFVLLDDNHEERKKKDCEMIDISPKFYCFFSSDIFEITHIHIRPLCDSHCFPQTYTSHHLSVHAHPFFCHLHTYFSHLSSVINTLRISPSHVKSHLLVFRISPSHIKPHSPHIFYLFINPSSFHLPFSTSINLNSQTQDS